MDVIHFGILKALDAVISKVFWKTHRILKIMGHIFRKIIVGRTIFKENIGTYNNNLRLKGFGTRIFILQSTSALDIPCGQF